MKKLYDGMIGLAIGDALGVPVEFKTRQEIAENPVREMREYGTHHQARGVWSDDTSLTLALVDSIVKCSGIDYNDIMERFSAWLLYGDYTATGEVFDVGNATGRAIMNYGHGTAPLQCGMVSEYENGNITPTALSKAYFDTIDAPLKTMVMIPAAGHNPMYERPEECTAALRAVRETLLRYYLGHTEKSL